MSICPSCGKELSAEESNSKFCAHCGKPLATETPVVEEAPAAENTTAEQPKQASASKINFTEIKEKIVSVINVVLEKIKAIPALAKIVEKVDEKLQPLVVVVIPFVLIVVLVIGILGSVIGAITYKAPLDRYLSLVNKGNTVHADYIYALSPDCRDNLLKKIVAAEEVKDDADEVLEEKEDLYKDIFEAIDDEFDSWKISFKEKSSSSLSQSYVDYYEANYETRFGTSIDNYEDILADDERIEDYADKYDIKETEAEAILKAYLNYYKAFDNISIDEIREVKGNFVIKADKHEWTSNTVRIYLIKVNGSWAFGGVNNDISFSDSDEELLLFSSFFELLEKSYAVNDLSSRVLGN